jgi:hypothetical protein
MLALFTALFACFGRANMTNLSRYGAGSRRRIQRWNQRSFDFRDFNLTALRQQGVLNNQIIAAFDPSFIPKSGKHTYGLGKFYNGSTSKAEKGLEICTVALVDLEENTAYTLHVKQTPSVLPEGQTRTDFYAQVVVDCAEQLREHTDYVVADGGLSKKKFVDGVSNAGLFLVGKLRKDSHLRYKYEGPKKKGRGRPKLYDGRVDYDDLERLEEFYFAEEDMWSYSGVVNHPEFKRDILVVILRKKKKGGGWSQVVLFSTDLSLDAIDVILFYKARFQIEFLFRDGKQFMGLADGQMRNEKGLDFHMNMALSGVNLMRLEDRKHQNIDGPRVISLGSWKRRKYNETLLERLFCECENELNQEKKEELYQRFKDFGCIAA